MFCIFWYIFTLVYHTFEWLQNVVFLNTILFKTKYKIFRKIQVAWWVSKTKTRFLAKYSHLYCFSFPLLKHSTNYVIIYNYNWPLNNMGLNCVVPLHMGFLPPLRWQDQPLVFLSLLDMKMMRMKTFMMIHFYLLNSKYIFSYDFIFSVFS